MKKRMMYFSDIFYPSDRNSIEMLINTFTLTLEETPEWIWRLDMMVSYAVIVPHDTWSKSGFTANIAYRVLAASMVDTIIVIAPSQNKSFKGIGVIDADIIETPIGEISTDKDLIQQLVSTFNLTKIESYEHEYATEVQFPFIRHYMPNVKVVELVCHQTKSELIEPIFEYLLQYQKYGLVISSDLSRYYSLEEANQTDAICLLAVENEDTYTLNEGCEASNLPSIEAMLQVAQRLELKSALLDYRTSSDSTGDTTHVTGYMSAIFQDKLF